MTRSLLLLRPAGRPVSSLEALVCRATRALGTSYTAVDVDPEDGALPVGEDPAAVVVTHPDLLDHAALVPPRLPTALLLEGSASLTTASVAARSMLAGGNVRVLCAASVARTDALAAGVAERDAVVVAPAAAGAPVAGERFVLGWGDAGWVAGTDLFLDVALRLRDLADVRCVWLGRRARLQAHLHDGDVARAGLADHVRWVDEVGDHALDELANAADAIVVTAREPIDRVRRAAVTTGTTPVVGFGTAGLDPDGSEAPVTVVPYPDTLAVAGRVREILGTERPTPEAGPADSDRPTWRLLTELGSLLGLRSAGSGAR